MAQFVNFFKVKFPGIPSVHPLEDSVGSRLNRQMDMTAQLVHRSEHLDQWIGKVLWMGCGEPNSVQPLHPAHPGKKFRKRAFSVLDAITVHILAEERDLADTVVHKGTDLPDNALGFSADLFPPDMGNDAIGAIIVAPLHDGNKLGHLTLHPVPGRGAELINNRRHLCVHKTTMSVFDLGDSFGKATDGMGAEHQIDTGHPLDDLFPLLLRHTATHGNDEIRFPFFQLCQSAEKTEYLLLGFGPDGTGVHHNQIRLFRRCDDLIIHRFQKAGDPLGIHHVHLTSDGMDVKVFRFHRSALSAFLPPNP